MYLYNALLSSSKGEYILPSKRLATKFRKSLAPELSTELFKLNPDVRRHV